jgi:hypothetical protein
MFFSEDIGAVDFSKKSKGKKPKMKATKRYINS